MASVIEQLQWLQRAEEQLAEQAILAGPLAIQSERVSGLWLVRQFSLWRDAAGAACPPISSIRLVMTSVNVTP